MTASDYLAVIVVLLCVVNALWMALVRRAQRTAKSCIEQTEAAIATTNSAVTQARAWREAAESWQRTADTWERVAATSRGALSKEWKQ
jgi:sensor c-di-GMP phosphodiesterase-like protein